MVAAVVVVTGCGAPGSDPGAAPSDAPPSTAGLPSEGELSPGWDESPDGASPESDSALDDAEIRALLRTGADSGGGDAPCRPGEVSAELAGFDVALGHRLTAIRVTNRSQRRCTVAGVPGIGARGTWGNRLMVAVSPDGLDSGEPVGPVTLAPREAAQARLEWTGSLAGAESERASLLVVQLARGQVPLRIPAATREDPDNLLDIGMDTTIHVQPFVPAAD